MSEQQEPTVITLDSKNSLEILTSYVELAQQKGAFLLSEAEILKRAMDVLVNNVNDKEIDNNLALNLLVQGVNKGQRHGVYTLNDASLISKVINFLLNLYQQQPLQSIPEEPEEQLQQEPLQEPLQQEPELDDNFDLNELSQPIPLKKSSLRVI